MDFIAIGTVVVLFVGIFIFPATSIKRAEKKLIKMFSPTISQTEVVDIEALKKNIIKNDA